MEVKRCLSCFPIGYSSLRRKTINSCVSNDTNLASAEASQVDLNLKKARLTSRFELLLSPSDMA